MSKKININRHISILLNRISEHFPFHNKTKYNENVTSNKILNIPPKYPYKAYARFPQITLPEPKKLSILRKTESELLKNVINIKILSNILYPLKKLVEGNRNRRLFEIYYYSIHSDIPIGLYHYYIRNHTFEKLPIFKKISSSKMFLGKKRNIKGLIFLSLRLSLLPSNNRDWWYRLNIAESGYFMFKLIHGANQNRIKMENTDFYDDTCNEFIGIDGIKESVIQVLRIY